MLQLNKKSITVQKLLYSIEELHSIVSYRVWFVGGYSRLAIWHLSSSFNYPTDVGGGDTPPIRPLRGMARGACPMGEAHPPSTISHSVENVHPLNFDSWSSFFHSTCRLRSAMNLFKRSKTVFLTWFFCLDQWENLTQTNAASREKIEKMCWGLRPFYPESFSNGIHYRPRTCSCSSKLLSWLPFPSEQIF